MQEVRPEADGGEGAHGLLLGEGGDTQSPMHNACAAGTS